MEKVCGNCGKEYNSTGGTQKYCGSRKFKRGCSYKLRLQYSTEYKSDNRKFYKPTPKELYRKYKYNAKTRKILFEISFEEFISFWGKCCYYCGAEVKTVGIDRINNKMGYIKTNIVSCCWGCNRMKSNISDKEFINKCKVIASKF